MHISTFASMQPPCSNPCPHLPPTPLAPTHIAATQELFKPLAAVLEANITDYCALEVVTAVAQAAAATPSAAAAVAAFTPVYAKALRMAAAAAAGEYPAGMDRAAAQAMLMAEGDIPNSSPAIKACMYLWWIIVGGLPEQLCKPLVEQCLNSVIKLLGTATDLCDSAAMAIAALTRVSKGVVAAI